MFNKNLEKVASPYFPVLPLFLEKPELLQKILFWNPLGVDDGSLGRFSVTTLAFTAPRL
jgi:hypothetical protein